MKDMIEEVLQKEQLIACGHFFIKQEQDVLIKNITQEIRESLQKL